MSNTKIFGANHGISTAQVIPDNQVALEIESTDAKDYITIDTTDGSESVNIGERVGIKESTPECLLHIYGGNSGRTTLRNGTNLLIEDSDENGIFLRSGASKEQHVYFCNSSENANAGMQFQGNVNRLNLLAGANIIATLHDSKFGVGTLSPGQILDVNDGSGNMIADGYDTHSLAAYKENISAVDAGYLAKVTACPPKQWTRKPYVSAEEIKAAAIEQFGQDVWDAYFPENTAHRAGALLAMPEGEVKTWIDAFADAKREERRTEEKWQRVNLGLVADSDDTAASFPEAIAKKDSGEISGINTMSYIGTLHAAIVELAAKVAALEEATGAGD